MAIDLEGMMRKIAALIANADSPATTPEAAETYRAKADELLAKYRLEEQDLITEGLDIRPISKKIRVTRYGSEFVNEHYWLFTRTARHYGVRYVCGWGDLGDGQGYGYVATVVGYDVDLRLLEMVFASALLVFGQHLEPTVDPKLGDVENVYRLRSAGIPRNRIANMLWGASTGSDGAVAHGKVGKLYKEACAARGENAAVSGRSINAGTYRKAYANSFVDAFAAKLRRARDAANAATGTLVSVDREKKVEEEFYRLFPSQRPTPEPEVTVETKAATGKTKAITKKQIAEYNRLYHGQAATLAGRAATAAVGKIQLDREAGQANRIGKHTPTDAKEIGS